MSEKQKGKWGGYRKGRDKYKYKTDTTTVRVPKPYRDAVKEYAKRLEQQDIDNGNLYQNENGEWVYRE